MLTRAAFQDLVDIIIQQHMKGEEEEYFFSRDALLEDIYAGKDPTSPKYRASNTHGAFHKISADQIIKDFAYIDVTFTLYCIIKEIISTYKNFASKMKTDKQTKQLMIESVAKRLNEKTKIGAEQSNQIAETCAKQLEKM